MLTVIRLHSKMSMYFIGIKHDRPIRSDTTMKWKEDGSMFRFYFQVKVGKSVDRKTFSCALYKSSLHERGMLLQKRSD